MECKDRYVITPNLPYFKIKIDSRLKLKKINKQFQYSSDLKTSLLKFGKIKDQFGKIIFNATE